MPTSSKNMANNAGMDGSVSLPCPPFREWAGLATQATTMPWGQGEGVKNDIRGRKRIRRYPFFEYRSPKIIRPASCLSGLHRMPEVPRFLFRKIGEKKS